MQGDNPYESPQSPAGEAVVQTPAASHFSKPSITQGTIVPRHIAATFDNMAAFILVVIVGKSLEKSSPWIQLPAVVIAYLAYFVIPEGAVGRTPGKLLTGLVVTQLDGTRCTWWQAIVRGLFRIVEVNPIFALPAAASIVMTRQNQRLGDKAAGTLVVFARRGKQKS